MGSDDGGFLGKVVECSTCGAAVLTKFEESDKAITCEDHGGTSPAVSAVKKSLLPDWADPIKGWL